MSYWATIFWPKPSRSVSCLSGTTVSPVHTQSFTGSCEHLFLEFLKTDFHNRLSTDVTIITEKNSITCHRLVLLSMSSYFRRLFDENESNQFYSISSLDTFLVRLPYPDAFSLVVHFLYYGEIQLTLHSVEHILQNAEVLEIPILANICRKYFTTEIVKENCLSLWIFADRHGFRKMRNYCSDLFASHPNDIDWKNNEFLLKILWDEIMTLGKEVNDLCVSRKTSETFKSIRGKMLLCWIERNKENIENEQILRKCYSEGSEHILHIVEMHDTIPLCKELLYLDITNIPLFSTCINMIKRSINYQNCAAYWSETNIIGYREITYFIESYIRKHFFEMLIARNLSVDISMSAFLHCFKGNDIQSQNGSSAYLCHAWEFLDNWLSVDFLRRVENKEAIDLFSFTFAGCLNRRNCVKITIISHAHHLNSVLSKSRSMIINHFHEIADDDMVQHLDETTISRALQDKNLNVPDESSVIKVLNKWNSGGVDRKKALFSFLPFISLHLLPKSEIDEFLSMISWSSEHDSSYWYVFQSLKISSSPFYRNHFTVARLHRKKHRLHNILGFVIQNTKFISIHIQDIQEDKWDAVFGTRSGEALCVCFSDTAVNAMILQDRSHVLLSYSLQRKCKETFPIPFPSYTEHKLLGSRGAMLAFGQDVFFILNRKVQPPKTLFCFNKTTKKLRQLPLTFNIRSFSKIFPLDGKHIIIIGSEGRLIETPKIFVLNPDSQAILTVKFSLPTLGRVETMISTIDSIVVIYKDKKVDFVPKTYFMSTESEEHVTSATTLYESINHSYLLYSGSIYSVDIKNGTQHLCYLDKEIRKVYNIHLPETLSNDGKVICSFASRMKV